MKYANYLEFITNYHVAYEYVDQQAFLKLKSMFF